MTVLRRSAVALAVALAALAVAGSSASAQVPVRRPSRPTTPTTPRTSPAVRDTIRPKAAGDSTGDTTIVQWLPTDSVMEALKARPNYSITRYQGDTVTFDARRGDLNILAGELKKSAVERGNQIVVTDTSIFYDDSTKKVLVRGTRIVVHDPSSGQADVVGSGSLSYDFHERAGRITNALFTINQNGQVWLITARDSKPVQGDSLAGRAPAFYGRGGTLTSCTDSIPDYHFAFKEVKKSSGNTLVARPAILYIRDIPVAWLPFIFQDTRGGRHSGILTPRFGLNTFIRNSSRYRREVDDFGYYWAISDYMDARLAFDWRSSNGDPADGPGWTKYKGEWHYNWLDRYLSGDIAADYTRQSSGSTNLALTWLHTEQFTRSTSLNANVNYVSNTFVQRQTALNPYQALGTISSSLNLTQKLGQASLALGGTRQQSPGRSQITQTLPSLTLSSPALAIASWLNWTPNLSYSRQQTLHVDQADPLSQRYVFAGDSVIAVKLDRSQTTQNLSFGTPIEIFGYSIRNSFSVQDQQANYPYKQNIIDPLTGQVTDVRVFTRTFSTQIDWTPEIQLPQIAQNRLKLTPSFGMSNAMGGPFWVRSQLTGGRFVHQSKRPTFGLSAAPSLYGFFPGFGPFTRIRHAINPTINYSFAPAYTPDTAFLRATGNATSSVLGLRQSQITLGLNTNFEAKVRSPNADTAGVGVQPGGEKITLLSLNFTGMSYDFERARVTHNALRGLNTDSWGYSLSSDLLPGFSFTSNYSLFSGSLNSDTAKFSPVLTGINASFQWNQTQNPLVVFRRLFGTAATRTETTPTNEQQPTAGEQQYMQQLAQAPVAGSNSRGAEYIPTAQQGFSTSLSFSMSKPRKPTGSNVIVTDQFAQCDQFRLDQPLVYEACRQSILANPTQAAVTQPAINGGGPAFYTPASMNMNGSLNFQLTPKWSAQWTTSYDFTRHEFAEQMVSLVRDLHDWRAVFAFTNSPNGNSAFNFFISLKAEPELRLPYRKSTIRTGQ